MHRYWLRWYNTELYW